MGGEEGKKEKGGDKSKKLDTSFKKAVGGSLKLKGVEFKGCERLPPACPCCAGPLRTARRPRHRSACSCSWVT